MADVVLVHGLWFGSWAMARLAGRVRARGHRAHAFSYPTLTQDPDRNAAELAALCRELGPGPAHFVGHSLGGLVILSMLQHAPDIRAGRVVFLGTPLNGSMVARRLKSAPPGGRLVGRAGELLSEGLSPRPGDAEFGMIAGTSGRGLGRLTGALDGPGDGTVTVAETRSEALSDHCELPVGHTGLLFSAEAARQAIFFIENGRFDHGTESP